MPGLLFWVGERLHRGARDRNARSGNGSVRLDIPPKAPLRGSGWPQEVAVKPLTTYLFGSVEPKAGI